MGMVARTIPRADSTFTPTGRTAWNNLVDKVLEIEISVADFGLVNDGSTDNSLAWAAAVADANTQVSVAVSSGFPIVRARLNWPAGDYVVTTGATVANLNMVIEGAGKSATRIRIGSGAYLLTATSTIYQLELRGISTSGGKGVISHTSTGVNVQGIYVVEDCNFHDYTECAIASLASDNPYWKIQRNEFYGAVGLTSKGIALAGARDMSSIIDNAFLRNRYHIKIANGGNNVKIRNNDFIRFTSGGGSPVLVDVWVVPNTSATNAGNGLQISGNKFGNENLDVADIRVLFADETTGTNFIDKNHATTASTGFVVGASIEENTVFCVSSQTRGFVYSYTPGIRYSWIVNQHSGAKLPYAVEYDSAVTFTLDDRTGDSNFFGWKSMVDGLETYTGPVSSQASTAIPVDPMGLMQAQTTSIKPWQSGCDIAFKDLLTNNDITAAGTTSASVSGITDSIGGSNAITGTYSASSGEIRINVTIANVVVGRMAWIEFDMKQSSVQPMTRVQVDIRIDAGSIGSRRVLNIPTYWQTIRIPWIPRQNGTQLRLKWFPGAGAYSGGVTDHIDIGRPRVYHAHEPVHHGARYLEAKATYDPPNLNDGTGTTTTVTCTGAALGDFAMASFSLDLQGIIVTAYVSAADTVSVIFQNESGGILDLASGTLRTRVYKLAAP